VAVPGGSCAAHAAYLVELSKVWHVCAHAYLTNCGIGCMAWSMRPSPLAGCSPENPPSIIAALRAEKTLRIGRK
jgi:hypothetical protein